MCQLLGMNCAAPTDFTFSLRGFCRRGGATDIHSHGFGLTVFENRGVRCFHDTLPACKSPIAELIQNYPIRTYNMLAHIRYATQGEVSLENVHPFNRVWKGVHMSFCHNGDCPDFKGDDGLIPLLGNTAKDDIMYHPVGDTDSEAIFCAILNALTVEFRDGLPTLPVLHEYLSLLCDEIVECNPTTTIFNFLLGCGQYTLFAYSWPGQRPGSTVWNGLHYIIRQPPFTTAKLLDTDYEIDFSTVTTIADRVAVITTKPLTEEVGWTEFKRGELIMFDKGLPYKTSQTCEFVENEGRGLFSKMVTAKCKRSPGQFWCTRRKRHASPPVLSLPPSVITTTTTTPASNTSDKLGTETPRTMSDSSLDCKFAAAAAAAAVEATTQELSLTITQESSLTNNNNNNNNAIITRVCDDDNNNNEEEEIDNIKNNKEKQKFLFLRSNNGISSSNANNNDCIVTRITKSLAKQQVTF